MASFDIDKIKANDNLRNDFISSYKPFIASCVYSIINKRVQYGIDEELSIALLAFNHAINRFDGRGSFLSFSKLVIKNRLYDYYRSNKRYGQTTEALYNEDETENHNIVNKSVAIYKDNDDILDLRAEIVQLDKQLSHVGIAFKELVGLSPKHRNKRKKIDQVVQFILHDDEALRYFKNSKNLPLKLLEDKIGISRKNIEPYRKYIITLLIIADSDYYYLREYLKI